MFRNLLVLLLWCACGLATAANVPSGFVETQIASGFTSATACAFAPDGRLFVTDQVGKVRVVKNRQLVAQVFLDLTSEVDTYVERGLDGIVLDPNFSNNGLVYLFYTVKAVGTTPAFNRVISVKAPALGAGDVAVPGSRKTIFELDPLDPKKGNHNGGGMVFGKDGKLYIAAGENAITANAQSLTSKLGKIHRLNPNGSIPADNPTPGSSIYCLGLRNPFTMAVQPGTGRIFIDDVGLTGFEEINEVSPKANFGWPLTEGLRLPSQLAPANYRDPIHTYSHNVGGCITGGDFYNPANPGPEAFGTVWTGRYFFADFSSGWIKWIDSAGVPPLAAQDFLTSGGQITDIAVADDGALWYLTRGSVIRVWSSANQVASKLSFIKQPTAVSAKTPLTPAVQVEVQEASGVRAYNANMVVTMAVKNGGIIGTASVKAIRGIATFSSLAFDTPSTAMTLTATSPGLASAISGVFQVKTVTANPSIQPGSGSFSGPITVQLSCNTLGSIIHYTLNGTVPTATSTTYSVPFQLSTSATINAIALAPGLGSSSVVMAAVTISGSSAYGLAVRPPVSNIHLPESISEVPATLSQTGLFANLISLTPAAGVIPYTVNSPLWSDGAAKQRWIALPPGGAVTFAANGEWQWPANTVFVKHFALGTRRLETRVLAYSPNGGSSYGVTYRWRADNSNADLVSVDGLDEQVADQSWHYPSQAQCMTCHVATAGTVLGPKTRQLNGSFAYPGGSTDNQLRTWNYLRMFKSDIGEANIAGFTRMVAVNDTSAGLEQRVRSYIDTNCSFCHRPYGVPTKFNLIYDKPLGQQLIIAGTIQDTLDIPGVKVITPQDPAKSMMHIRMASAAADIRMPPLGRNLTDQVAVDTLVQWINSLPKGKGLRAEYWSAQDHTLIGNPTVSRIDATVNFNWISTKGTPNVNVSSEAFTARWSGALQPAFSETFTFHVNANGGVRLRVGSSVLVNQWTHVGSGSWSGTIQLQAGLPVPVVLEYAQVKESALISLQWSSPSLALEVIPQYRLLDQTPGLFQARVNFQPTTNAIPSGYLVDSGTAYAVHGSQPTYGWNSNLSATARKLVSDLRLDTFVAIPDFNTKWEIAVPNGTYQVNVACGDALFTSGSSYQLLIEDVLGVSGIPTSGIRWINTSNNGIRVQVTDGRLTLRNGPGAIGTKICYVDLSQVPTFAQ